MPTLKFTTPIERHTEAVARFAVFPANKIAAWKQTNTFVVDASMNGTPLGHRSMVYWKERNGWFIGLSEPMCRKAGVDTGDVCEFVLTLVEEFVPAELAALLARDKAAFAVWKALSPAGQRMEALQISSAKQAATRARRAQKLIEQLKASY